MKNYILIVILFITCSCGSYFYSENYTFDVPREQLINKIKDFKEMNPEYKVITTFENGKRGELPDEMVTNNMFYGCFFYIPDSHVTVNCVINMSNEISSSSAKIQLVGVSKSKNFGSWKGINTKELSRKENAEIKKVFETQILDKLGIWKRD